jgi:amidophosphoribosyltransferase
MAGNLTVDEIRQSIGADSLGFVSLDGLIAATKLPSNELCRACFDGDYPISVADDEKGKHLLETVGLRVQGPA